MIKLHILIHSWDITRFEKYLGSTLPDTPSRYSERAFMDELAAKLNVTKPSDWLKVTTTSLQQQGASSLIKKYNGSLTKLLTTIYPEYKQVCRDAVMKMVKDMKVNNVQELVHIPVEYHKGHQLLILTYSCKQVNQIYSDTIDTLFQSVCCSSHCESLCV